MRNKKRFQRVIENPHFKNCDQLLDHLKATSQEMTEAFCDPDGPDKITVNIQRYRPDEPGLTFSAESGRAVLNQIDMFFKCRIHAGWKRNKKPPQKMRITVEVEVE